MKSINELYGITRRYGYMPSWAWEVESVLSIHGPMTNKEIAELICKPPQRTHEVIAKMHRNNAVIKQRVGKQVYVHLPQHLCQ